MITFDQTDQCRECVGFHSLPPYEWENLAWTVAIAKMLLLGGYLVFALQAEGCCHCPTVDRVADGEAASLLQHFSSMLGVPWVVFDRLAAACAENPRISA